MRQKVEIPIDIQLHHDSAFFNEFVSQAEPGQWAFKYGSDTDTSIDLGIDNLITQESEDSYEESPAGCYKNKLKKIGQAFSFEKL